MNLSDGILNTINPNECSSVNDQYNMACGEYTLS
jgi:hypothetical protein